MDALLIRLLLLHPTRVQRHLDEARPRLPATPTLFQLVLGIAYMYHRIWFRPETIGTPDGTPVRDTRRARRLAWRIWRAPGLLWERAVLPFDHTGIATPMESKCRHLLATWHPNDNAIYDLQILALIEPAALRSLRERVVAVIDGTHPRASWLRDLVVHDGYHEKLLRQIDQILASGGKAPEPDTNPDTTFTAFLAWCAAQPPTFAEAWSSWRTGRLDFAPRVPGFNA